MYSGRGKGTSAKYAAMICGFNVVWSCAASFGYAQATQAPPLLPGESHVEIAHAARTKPSHTRKHPADVQDPTSARPLYSFDLAARSAVVSFTNGKLAVEANNSDLTQILQDMAKLSGMTIKGLSKGPRIFGVYGPGDSRNVLTELLIGSGYNFVMVGGAIDGAPRELLLTSRVTGVQDFTPANPHPVPAGDREETEQQKLELLPSASGVLGPGAISPTPSQNDQDDNTRVQRTLERLQHMQEQQTPPQ
jgi:hypothetical protein